jgi:methylase of polypeptide subunit release factors
VLRLAAHRVLDVGCGCGFIAACAAVLAGKQGTVVGVDIKPACISLSSDNISRLRASSSRCVGTGTVSQLTQCQPVPIQMQAYG